MPATAKLQRTSLLECQEKAGVITRVVMEARVIDLSDTSYQALTSALNAAGVPVAGAKLTGSGFNNLILTERHAKVVDEDRSTVDVTLVYERLTLDVKDLDDPPAGFITGEVRANVQQVTTNLDIEDNVIEVEHTYPSTDPDYADTTIIQGGEVQFYQPARTITLEGIKQTAYPWLTANSIIGRVNKSDWMGQAKHEWMCTGVSWRLHDIVDGKYFMSFEFQHNPDTWNPTAVFIDDRTGKPPQNLVVGAGIKYIRRHEEVDFDNILGVRLQAG